MAKVPSPPVAVSISTTFIADTAVRSTLTDLVAQINAALRKFSPSNSPTSNILLSSPNGTIYAVTVADDGTLKATKP